jgi:hypothetical protein
MDTNWTDSIISAHTRQPWPKWPKLPTDSRFMRPRRVCNFCQKEASQWIEFREAAGMFLYESRCHGHRLKKPKTLLDLNKEKPGRRRVGRRGVSYYTEDSRFITRDEIRVMEVMQDFKIK